MLSAIAVADERTMVWAEVFAGGIGGMVARYQPGATPSPQRMRASITAWYQLNNIPWEGRDSDYAVTREGEGKVLVADDADVSAIAVHVTRMAIESLTAVHRLVYSHAAYVLGLKPGWLFDQAMDTYPIDVGSPEDSSSSGMTLSPDSVRENVEFITDLLQRASCETASSG
jgi:hypothetical protein